MSRPYPEKRRCTWENMAHRGAPNIFQTTRDTERELDSAVEIYDDGTVQFINFCPDYTNPVDEAPEILVDLETLEEIVQRAREAMEGRR